MNNKVTPQNKAKGAQVSSGIKNDETPLSNKLFKNGIPSSTKSTK